MSVKQFALALIFTSAALSLMAQETMTTPMAEGGTYRSLTPKDQWELGVDLGVPMIIGDVDAKFPGFGGGLHVRKAFDHIFSVRVGGMFAKMENENERATPPAPDPSTSETTWASGSIQLVAALNNIRFDKPNRKILLNGFFGIGVDNFKTDFKNVTNVMGSDQDGTVDETNAHLEIGGGIAFRINRRFNIALEHTVMTVLGGNADLLDGNNNYGATVTTYRDFVHYPHISLNFNLGGKDKNGNMKSEPLYWVNPLDQTAQAISALEARPVYDPTDTDGDGIIDAIDEEDNSPAGARVDTKGMTLDSDMDKVADYKDKEPYSPPGYSVDANGVAQVPKPITEDDVNRIVDAKLAKFKLPEIKQRNFSLPMINFADNSYTVAKSQWVNLYQVAQAMKNNTDVKVVVTGYTDQRGPEGYNAVLSYNRAKAAIEALVANYGVDRSRLILNYGGETNNIIPAKGSNMINRRAEFRIATNETDQARPEGPNAGRGKFEGNTGSGY